MAICAVCNSENLPGMRWCSICRTNLLKPSIGRLATPARRFWATVLDVVWPFIIFTVFFVFFNSDASLGIGAVLFLGYIVWALVQFARGATPGKKLLGIRVIKEDGCRPGFFTMLFREWIGKCISGLILGIGYFWILFDRDKQGWHDKLVSTYVIEAASADRQTPVTV